MSSYVFQTTDIIRKHIEREEVIILVVGPCHTDIATVEALKLAKVRRSILLTRNTLVMCVPGWPKVFRPPVYAVLVLYITGITVRGVLFYSYCP